MANLDIAGLVLQPQEDTEDAPLAQRVRDWFIESYNHPLWIDFRRDSKEDEGFYVGGDGQWSINGSTADLDRLVKERRAHVSFNHIQSVVDVLTGFERQNRFDLKAAPQGEEDAEDAKILTWVMKHEQEKSSVNDLCSEVFEDGVIKGCKIAEVGVDWQEDPVRGEIKMWLWEAGHEVLWDPWSTMADLSDARYALKFRHVFLQDILAEYPKQAAAIREAAGALPLLQDARQLDEGDPTDRYGSVGSPHHSGSEAEQMFWSPTERKLLVIEAWYREYEDIWLVADKLTGKILEADSGESARALAESDPKHLTVHEKRRRVIRMAVTLPAIYHVLEEGNPYENDDQAYPLVPYIAKRKAGRMYGIVRNLKDPQINENKRESHALDIVSKLGNIRPMAEGQSVENTATLKETWSSEPVIYRPGHQPPGWYAPPIGELVRVLETMGARNVDAIRRISGINTDLLGERGATESGIAIARRQAQGQVISTVFFDNYRRFRKLVGQRLARRIQQVYTMERVVRLTDDSGAQLFYTINPAGLTAEEVRRDPALRRRMAAEIDKLKFDIIISEAPSTPSMRATALLALLEVLRVLPGLAPAVMDIVIQLAELPDKAIVLQRVNELMAAARGLPPGAGEAGEPGGPGVSMGPGPAAPVGLGAGAPALGGPAPGRPPLSSTQAGGATNLPAGR